MEKLTIVRPEEVYIDFIATSPDFRSKGIGAQLIEFVRGTLGYKAIELEVFSKNPKAKLFYEREGFKAIRAKNNFIMAIQGFGKRIIMRWEKS
jgi:ribosomal protein S18 acetylase RimI-like enzyme